MLCHWIPYFLCLFSHLAPLESIKSGNFATSIFQYYRYRDQSVTWNYYLQNGSNHDEFLLKFAFFGQEEKRICTCVRAKVVQQCARTLWLMWCLPGTHPRGLTPPAPTLEHPQIPTSPARQGDTRGLRGRKGQLWGSDSLPRLSCTRFCVTSRISQSPCFSSAAVTQE